MEQNSRDVPLEMSPELFRTVGHELVDQVATLLATIRDRPVAPGETPTEVRAIFGEGPLPDEGVDPARLLADTTAHLLAHSTFNGHPRFFGYISGSPAPIGVLADLLGAAINPNVGAWALSPLATEIERQAVRWVAELIGYPANAGGLFVSGGNMANLVCCATARSAAGRTGLPMAIYASSETHTWVQKASDFLGFGAGAVHYVAADAKGRMDPDALAAELSRRAEGEPPALIVGTAGTVSTGAIDPLRAMAEIARAHDAWLHVDGAYGAPAACTAGAPADLEVLALADSVAVDPHKWLYAPLEVGCALVRDRETLHAAFCHRPPYYHFDGSADDPPTNFYEWGPQNSRGFRALKVWLALRQAGRSGYQRMISDDIELARRLYAAAEQSPEIEAGTISLSIVTFRYVPADLRVDAGSGTPWAGSGGPPAAPPGGEYLDALNAALLSDLQAAGAVYLSNAVIGGRFFLRACIVNFRTRLGDVLAIPGLVTRAGRLTDARLRPAVAGDERHSGGVPK